MASTCAAPTVMAMLASVPPQKRVAPTRSVRVLTAGRRRRPCWRAIGSTGFEVDHVYGITEASGTPVSCAWQACTPRRWKGRRWPTPTPWNLPADGVTAGEVLLRGNTVMKGYLKNLRATVEAFAGGWFHTGDVAVVHPDGYLQITDRSKDVIISGGESISSVEVEDVLRRHP